MEPIRLTQYSHGAGCGCKISPKILTTILEGSGAQTSDINLWVGNQSRDDAAVYGLDATTGIISTTDFFMPIVDDPYDFGRIAATNAISDIYAMGGTPIMAIAILGWPIDTLAPEIAKKVIEGGRKACDDAGIVLAGGHSIDAPEPIFGLAVTGKVEKRHLKQNDTATNGDLLFLTKPIGIGILTTAEKKGLLQTADRTLARDTMVQLNTIGTALAKLDYVTAMTDVTGFGLLGHVCEVAEGSKLSAILYPSTVPLLNHVTEYVALGAIPGGTERNFASYGHKIAPSALLDLWRPYLCDPQTSGGLLVAIKPEHLDDFKRFLGEENHQAHHIGLMEPKQDYAVQLREA